MSGSGTERASECVLIVDDEELIRDTLSELVEMAGCSAVCAANGAEALRVLAERQPCLVILDLKMPVMNGQEFLAALAGEPSFAGLPVVISTSAPQNAPAGFAVIPKPIDIESVFRWVRQSCTCAAEPSAT